MGLVYVGNRWPLTPATIGLSKSQGVGNLWPLIEPTERRRPDSVHHPQRPEHHSTAPALGRHEHAGTGIGPTQARACDITATLAKPARR